MLRSNVAECVIEARAAHEDAKIHSIYHLRICTYVYMNILPMVFLKLRPHNGWSWKICGLRNESRKLLWSETMLAMICVNTIVIQIHGYSSSVIRALFRNCQTAKLHTVVLSTNNVYKINKVYCDVEYLVWKTICCIYMSL